MFNITDWINKKFLKKSNGDLKISHSSDITVVYCVTVADENGKEYEIYFPTRLFNIKIPQKYHMIKIRAVGLKEKNPEQHLFKLMRK